MAGWDRSQRLDAWLIGLGVAIGLAGVVLAIALRSEERPLFQPGSTPTGWSEVPWTLPVDPWWPSKAFTCTAATCGADLKLYVRAKIGFCNCKTGVADDEELERIGDFAVIARRHAPIAAGRPIQVAWMKGRSRPYAFDGKAPGPTRPGTALLIGYNDRCDAIVATAVLEQGSAIAVETAVLEFLASPKVIRWSQVTLGL